MSIAIVEPERTKRDSLIAGAQHLGPVSNFKNPNALPHVRRSRLAVASLQVDLKKQFRKLCS